MTFFDSTNTDSVDFIYFPVQVSGTDFTTTTTWSTDIIIEDKDWMPYTHFEYDPIWHKKFAAIKYQMQIMWN